MNQPGPKGIRPRLAKLFTFIEEFGNSLALYTLLIMIIIGIWFASPLPSPDLTVNGNILGWLALFFISISALHGILWWIITREFLRLSPKVKQILSTSIKLIKPLHMMTGMLGLGLGFIHGFTFFQTLSLSNIYIVSGLIALVTLLILAIDGIGLMMTPFLSRQVHRWIASVFLVAVIVHLMIIFA